MYNRNRKLSSKKSVSLIVLVLMALISGSFFLYSRTQRPSSTTPSTDSQIGEETVNLSPPTDAEKQQVEENKINDGRERTPAPGTTPPPADKSAKISQASYDSAGRRLVVQTQLFGTGWTQCTLEVTQGTRKVTKTAETLYQPNFSTCMGFSVDAAEFATGGEWNVLIKASNKDGKVYTSNPEKVNIIK